MSDFGVTENGFVQKPFDDILTDKNDQAIAVFGENLDVSPQSPDGQYHGLLALSDSDLWQLAKYVYDAFNPNAATGITLSNLVTLNGITRLGATGTLVELTLTGTDTTLIPAGSLVQDTTGNQFATKADVTISGGTATVTAECTVTGEIEVLINTVTTIVTAITGWATVDNLSAGVKGRDEETDTELRIRRQNSVAFPSQSMLDSIFAAVSNVEGVRSTLVIENDLDIAVGTQPAHSIQTIVDGGVDEDIAQQIFLKKAAGIQAFGTTIVPITDSQGISHDIGLTRPTLIPIFVTVNLTTFGDYPADGDTLIKEALVAYGESEFGLGDDVVYSRLYTPINSVPGHQIDSLFIGTSASPVGTSNIPIDIDELSSWDVANIVVNS